MKKQKTKKPSLQELTNLLESVGKEFFEETPRWGELITANQEWIRRKNLLAIRTNISALMSYALKFASDISNIEYELTSTQRAYRWYDKAKEKK
jgi:hypothetical protein